MCQGCCHPCWHHETVLGECLIFSLCWEAGRWWQSWGSKSNLGDGCPWAVQLLSGLSSDCTTGSQLTLALPAPVAQGDQIWRSSNFFFPHWALPFGLFAVIPGIRWGTIAQGSEADCSPACFSIALHLVLSFLPGPSGCIMVPTRISQEPWTDKQGKGWDGLAQRTETNIPSCTAYTNNMCFVLMDHSLPRYPQSFTICVSSVTVSCRKDCSQYSAKE